MRDPRPGDDCAGGSASLRVEGYATGGRGEGVFGEEGAAAFVGEIIERCEVALGTQLDASSKLVMKKKPDVGDAQCVSFKKRFYYLVLFLGTLKS